MLPAQFNTAPALPRPLRVMKARIDIPGDSDAAFVKFKAIFSRRQVYPATKPDVG